MDVGSVVVAEVSGGLAEDGEASSLCAAILIWLCVSAGGV